MNAESVTIDKEKLVEYFSYLDDLRESGVTNMWGAAPYLMRDCGLRRKIAVEVLSRWMKTFSSNVSLDGRVQNAMDGGPNFERYRLG